jgi:glycerophosphoryl diester phosphodiesterase
MNQVSSPYYNNKMHSQSLQKSPSVGIFQSIDQRAENHDRKMKRFYTSCPLFSFEPNVSSDSSVSSTSSIPSIAASDISVEFSLGPVELESLESRFMKTSLPSPHGQSNQFSLLTHLNVDADSRGTMNSVSHRPKVVGHRGHLYRSLENTRHSIRLAAEHCQEVEIDVFLLKCGTLIVFHGGGSDQNPGCLKEYCNREGSILDLTYEEARNLKFNPHHLEFGCGPGIMHELAHEYYIPTLQEVLSDARETGVVIKIELKGPGTPDPVLELVEDMGMTEQVHYSSFDHSRIKRIRELRPHRNVDGSYLYKTGALFDEPPENFVELALEVGASEVHLKYSTCTTEMVQKIHGAGMDSMIWMRGPVGMIHDVTYLFHDVGNEDESMYLAIMKTGVKAMCVNKPDVLANLLMKQQMMAQ